MENTSGFYFNDNGSLVFSPTSVYFPDGTFILADLKDAYQYPVNGWTWFDSEEAARVALLSSAPDPSAASPGRSIALSLLLS